MNKLTHTLVALFLLAGCGADPNFVEDGNALTSHRLAVAPGQIVTLEGPLDGPVSQHKEDGCVGLIFKIKGQTVVGNTCRNGLTINLGCKVSQLIKGDIVRVTYPQCATPSPSTGCAYVKSSYIKTLTLIKPAPEPPYQYPPSNNPVPSNYCATHKAMCDWLRNIGQPVPQ